MMRLFGRRATPRGRSKLAQCCLDPVVRGRCSANRMVNEAHYFYWGRTGLVTMVSFESLYDLAPDSLNSSQIGLLSPLTQVSSWSLSCTNFEKTVPELCKYAHMGTHVHTYMPVYTRACRKP